MRRLLLYIIFLFVGFITQGQSPYASSNASGVAASHSIIVRNNNSDNLEVCLSNSIEEFSTTIVNNSGIEMTNVVVIPNTPSGLIVTAVSNPNYTLVTESGHTKLQLTNSIAIGATVEVKYKLKADCSIIDVLQPSLNQGVPVVGRGEATKNTLVEYTLNTVNYFMPQEVNESFRVKYGELATITSANDIELPVVKGDIVKREIKIQNSGAGSIETIKVRLELDNHPQKAGTNLKLLKLSYQGNPLVDVDPNTNDNIYEYNITLSSPLASGVAITLEEEVEIIGCDPIMASTYTSFWGCGSVLCNTTGSSKEVYYNYQVGKPFIQHKLVSFPNLDYCDASKYKVQIEFVNQSTSATLLDRKKNKAFINDIEIYRLFSTSNYKIKSNLTGNEWVSLNMPDNSSILQIPNEYSGLEAGEKIELEYDIAGYCGAMSNGLRDWRFISLMSVDNVCGDEETSVGIYKTNNSNYQNATPSISVVGEGLNISDGNEYNYTFSIDRTYSSSIYTCSNTYYSDFELPNGLKIVPEKSFWIPKNGLKEQITESDISLVNGKYRVSKGGVKGKYSMVFLYNCPENINGSNFTNINWTMYFECCPTCSQSLVNETLEVIVTCDNSSGQGGGNSCLPLKDFKSEMNRTTLGWKNTITKYDEYSLLNAEKVNPDIDDLNLKAAYPGDQILMTLEANTLEDIDPNSLEVGLSYNQNKNKGNLLLKQVKIKVDDNNFVSFNVNKETVGTFQKELAISLASKGLPSITESIKVELVLELIDLDNQSFRSSYELQRLLGFIRSTDSECSISVFSLNKFAFYTPQYSLNLFKSHTHDGYGEPARLASAVQLEATSIYGTDFPNEYRPLIFIDQFKIQKPDGFKNSNALGGIEGELMPYSETSDEVFWKSTPNTPISLTHPISYRLGHRFLAGFPVDCSIDDYLDLPPEIISAEIKIKEKAYLLGTKPLKTVTTQFDATWVYNIDPGQRILSTEEKTGINSVVSWTTKLCGDGISRQLNPWVSIEPSREGTTIQSVTVDGVLTTLQSYNGNYKLLDITRVVSSGQCLELEISATYEDCEEGEEEIKLISSTETFPHSGVYPDVSNHTGSIKTLSGLDCDAEIVENTLILQHYESNMAGDLESHTPALTNLCEPVNYKFKLQSTGQANIQKEEFTVDILVPKGVLPSNVKFNYIGESKSDIGLSSIQTVPDIIGDYLKYSYNLSPKFGPEGFKGAIQKTDLIDREIIISFDVEGDCTMDPGLPIRVESRAKSNCGEDRIVNGQKRLRLRGDFQDLEELTIGVTASDYSSLNPENTVEVTYDNPDGTINSNQLEVTLPIGVSYVGGSFTPISPTESTINDQTVLTFDITNNPQKKVSFRTTLDVTPVEDAEFEFKARTTFTGTANCGTTACPDMLVATTGLGLGKATVVTRVLSITIDPTAKVCVGTSVTLKSKVIGTGPFTYEWTNVPNNQKSLEDITVQTTATQNTYTLKVTDAEGYEATTSYTIPTHPDFGVSLSAQGITCAGSTDGTLTVNITGSSAPYNVILEENVSNTWVEKQNVSVSSDKVFDNLALGNYRVTVTDVNGCTKTLNKSVPYHGSVINSLCVGKIYCGEDEVDLTFRLVRVRPSSGTYTYKVKNVSTGLYVSNTGGQNTFTGTIGQTKTIKLDNISAGSYVIELTDDNSCSLTQNITISNFQLGASSDQGQYKLCFQGQDALVKINVGNNKNSCTSVPSGLSYEYQLEKWNEQTQLYEPVGNVITSTLSTQEYNLKEGKYRVKVKYGNDCPSVYTNEFEVIVNSVVRAEIKPQDDDCEGAGTGSAQVYLYGTSGGLSYRWLNADDTELQDGGSKVTGLTAGDYKLQIVGLEYLCEGETPDPIVFTIDQLDPITNLEVDGTGVCTATATVTGGTGPYVFKWHKDGAQVHYEQPVGVTSTTSEDAGGVGNFTVNVTDANGCTAQASKTIQRLPVDRKYDICFNWATRSTIPPPPPCDPAIDDCDPEPDSPTKIKQVVVSLTDQKVECIKRQTTIVKAEIKQKCFNTEFIEDELSLEYTNHYQHFTLYYYDRVGQLIQTVPPAGVQFATSRNELPAHTLRTKYEYNTLGQLVKQITPDGGRQEYVYDNFNQLVSSINSNFSSYSKYDELGRAIEVGNSDGTEQTFTVFSEPAEWISYEGKGQQYLRNRISYIYNVNKNGDKEYTYFSYDPHSNVEWIVQEIAGFGRTTIAYDYDLISGNVKEVAFNKGRVDSYFHKYTYDGDNRIVRVKTSRDGYLWDEDATYKYYLHGALERTEIGEDKIQGCDYAYTIHGWLKGINTPNISSSEDLGQDGSTVQQKFASDVYGMSLQYYKGDYVSDNALSGGQYELSKARNLYNGNISAWMNRTQATNSDHFNDQLTGRTFTYDRLNRIKESDFYNYNGGWTDVNQYGSSYSYDANGNITSLNRDGYAGAIDQLTYSYNANTNQLNHVVDGVQDAKFDDLSSQDVNNYKYDGIGQLVRDESEKLTIVWDIQGNLSEVIPDYDPTGEHQKPHLIFSYDALGNRVKKMVNHQPYENGNLVSQKEYPERFKTTFYSRDASGNIMGIYERENRIIDGGVNDCSGSSTNTTTGYDPYEAPGCDEGTPLSGAFVSIDAGQVYRVPQDGSFTGVITMNGGTLLACGNMDDLSGVVVNWQAGGILVVQGDADLTAWGAGFNYGLQVYNYGHVTFNHELVVDANSALYNYGELTIKHNFTLKPGTTLENYGHIEVKFGLVPVSSSIYGGATINLHTGSSWDTYSMNTYPGSTITHTDGSCSNINIVGAGGAANLNDAVIDGNVNICGTANGGSFINGATNDCAVECLVERCNQEKYYTATYKLVEIPLYGSDRIGQLNTDVVISEQVFRQDETAIAHFDYDDIDHQVAQEQTLVATSDQAETAEGLCISNETLQLVKGEDQSITNLVTFYGASKDGLAMIENEDNDLVLYATTGLASGNKNSLLLYNASNKLIKGQSMIEVDGEAKPHIVQVPNKEFEYYVFVRLKDGAIHYDKVDVSATGYATGGLVTASGSISGTGFGRHLASIEDLPEEKVYLYLTKYINGTNTLYKVELTETIIGTPEAGAVYVSADKEGDGQIEIAPDAQSILVYNHRRKMGWFDHSYSEILRVPFGADYLPANEGQGYAYEHISFEGGNVGVGQASHSQENDHIYYSKNSLVLDTEGNHKGFYRQGLLVTNSMITEKISPSDCGSANRQLSGGVLLSTTNDNVGVYRTDGAKETPESFDVQYTLAATGFVNGVPHKITYDKKEKETFTRLVGAKYYESKDHLGNVRVVYTDMKVSTLDNAGQPTKFDAEIVSFSNYYPFGWTEPGRNASSERYRYGFNGMEKDDEVNGSGKSYTTELRQYDSRLGRWKSIDPYNQYHSPYVGLGNNPINGIDPNGGWWSSSNKKDAKRFEKRLKSEGYKYERSENKQGDIVFNIEYQEGADYYDDECNCVGIELKINKKTITFKQGDNKGNANILYEAGLIGYREWGSRVADTKMKRIKHIARAADTWAEGEGGQDFAKFIASFNPLISVTNAAYGYTTGHNMYGDKTTTTDNNLELLSSIPGVGLIKLGKGAKYLPLLIKVSKNSQRVHHIMQAHHAWGKLFANPTWKKVMPVIAEVLETGVEFPYKNSAYSKIGVYKGFKVQVTYIYKEGVKQISDAWIITTH